MKEIQDHQVREFITTERRRGLNPRSLKRELSSIRSFFNYLLDEEIIKTNPAVNISSPKLTQLLPKALDTDLVKRLLDFKPDGNLEIRDKANEIVSRTQLKTNPEVIAISKTFKADKILPLLEAGHIHYGENKIQETEDKWVDLKKKI